MNPYHGWVGALDGERGGCSAGKQVGELSFLWPYKIEVQVSNPLRHGCNLLATEIESPTVTIFSSYYSVWGARITYGRLGS